MRGAGGETLGRLILPAPVSRALVVAGDRVGDGRKERAMRLTFSALVLASAGPALGQGLCADRETVIKTLTGQFHETAQARGIAEDGRMVEIYAAPDGSWTIILTAPTGRSCIAASGHAYRAIPAEAHGEDM